ncbi:hypothetical protein [Streptomyces acidicola]|uniref:Uncharacterized protein n=1 Tax=Streptomyces acidicola TaxID=2596892 RepID=A0A5N8WX37_9ACTN|nr:hypothetical protein [Streptomyces acidicola]MPY51961.1 hypothetical protein [Streptomyces acidicola]
MILKLYGRNLIVDTCFGVSKSTRFSSPLLSATVMALIDRMHPITLLCGADRTYMASLELPQHAIDLTEIGDIEIMQNDLVFPLVG